MRKLILATLFLIGCGGTVEPITYWHCPSEIPPHGEPCDWDHSKSGRCFFLDECTNDLSGVEAICRDGKWQIAVNLVAVECPSTPPAEGAPCPCGNGRQESPCEYQDRCGGSLTATCDPATMTWSLSAQVPRCGAR